MKGGGQADGQLSDIGNPARTSGLEQQQPNITKTEAFIIIINIINALCFKLFTTKIRGFSA